MPSVLSISSEVAAGPVGNSAIAPALLSLDVTPLAVPTIVLSNHPGHGRPEGIDIPAATLSAMLARLADLKFLADCRVVMTGYFATAAQVTATAEFIGRIKTWSPDIYYLCDPVIGDDGELFVEPEIAQELHDLLVPLSDGLIPNATELALLSGQTVDDFEGAVSAAQLWPEKDVIVTSIPAGNDLITAHIKGGAMTAITRPRLKRVPHGTGDLLSGLIAGHLARGERIEDSLADAIATVERVIAASSGTAVLNLTALTEADYKQSWISRNATSSLLRDAKHRGKGSA